MNQWLTALGVFCLCIVVMSVTLCIVMLINSESVTTSTSSTSTSTSTSTSSSTSPKKECYETKLRIDLDKDCEQEYERLVCPRQQCRPEETNRMCDCLISPDELRTLPFVGKTYVSGNRKLTINSNGEVLTQDNPTNNCFKAYVSKTTTVQGTTRYVLGASSYYENGLVYIYDGVSGDTKVATELSGYTPRTDCVNILRW